MRLVDTHAHLEDEKFQQDRAEVIDRAVQAGITTIIDFGDDMAGSASAVHLSEEFEPVYAGVGVHPEEAFLMTGEDDARLAEWAAQPKVVAIGEIGLDYYWEKDHDKRELQRRIFIRQLDLARQLGLPVCIHDREAHGDTLSILKKEGKNIRGVLHCYSGSLEMARELVRMGWYLGFDGPVTFKNSRRLVEIVQALPLECMLIETDCPYMAPEPYRGRRNEPFFVKAVAQKLADLRQVSLAEIAEVTTCNAEYLYGV